MLSVVPVNVLKSLVLVYAVNAPSTTFFVFAVVEYLLNSLLNAPVSPVVGV